MKKSCAINFVHSDSLRAWKHNSQMERESGGWWRTSPAASGIENIQREMKRNTCSRTQKDSIKFCSRTSAFESDSQKTGFDANKSRAFWVKTIFVCLPASSVVWIRYAIDLFTSKEESSNERDICFKRNQQTLKFIPFRLSVMGA